MLKFTLVVSWIFADLMAVLFWGRFSGGGAAVAEVAALPVVWDLLSVVPLVWALSMPLLPSRLSVVVVPLLLSRPSAFMSLPPLGASVSELMLFDFSPCMRLPSWALLLGAILSVDSFVPVSAPFMPE